MSVERRRREDTVVVVRKRKSVSVVFCERETRSSIPVVVFLALLSSLSFFQKSDDETAFQIPPRDARAREKERVERERETTQ